jgi:poly-D-alanine transfer protein DltD
MQLDYPISFTMKYAVEESAENARSFPKNVMSDTGQRGRLLHNKQFAPFYGSVALENAPNLHAGFSQAEMRKRQEAQVLVVSQPPPWPSWCFI